MHPLFSYLFLPQNHAIQEIFKRDLEVFYSVFLEPCYLHFHELAALFKVMPGVIGLPLCLKGGQLTVILKSVQLLTSAA